jgi:hypothetical protein
VGPWRDLDPDPTAEGDSPVSVAEAWLRLHGFLEAEPEVEVELLRLGTEGNRSVVLLRRWGFDDDSLAGDELRLHLQRSSTAGVWRVTGVERRWYCRRGLGAEGLCL